jgi:3-phosphoshikimate 1-carboxyvinyltransferase
MVYGTVKPPSSKSYTHRAITIASIASGESIIRNPLLSRDTIATIEACRAFGAEIDTGGNFVKVKGTRPSVPDDVIDAQNSGTTLRFMTTLMAAASHGYTIITGDSSLRKRPMQPLLDSISKLGAKAFSSRNDGHAPIIVQGDSLIGGETEIDGSISSQFVSSILISSPLAQREVKLRVNGAVSRPYIDATVLTMKKYGIDITRDSFQFFQVPAGGEYRASEFAVPSDFSSMAFLIGCVAIAGGKLRLDCTGLSMPQADSKILQIARAMGLKLTVSDDLLLVEHGGEELEGGTFDLSDSPDLLPVVSVLGLACKKGVKIIGVRHARYKETDRISMLNIELTKAGARVKELDDGLIVKPGEFKKVVLNSYGDHRLFMAFSLVSLLSKGEIRVSGEDSVDVSYPSFVNDLEKLGVKVRRVKH